MKNVAATNGQSVSLAALFFGMESTWEGTWAGTDMLLNFYDRPPWAVSARDAAGRANSHSKNTRSVPARKEKMHASIDSFASGFSRGGGLQPSEGDFLVVDSPGSFHSKLFSEFSYM